MARRLGLISIPRSERALNSIRKDKRAVIFVHTDQRDAERSGLWNMSSQIAGVTSKVLPMVKFYAVFTWESQDSFAWVYDLPKLQIRNSKGQLTCMGSTGTIICMEGGRIINLQRKIKDSTVEEAVSKIKTLWC